MPGYSTAYSQHYPTAGQQQPPPTQQTIGQVFQQRGLWQWWTQNGGKGTNAYDGVSEKGQDYASTYGTPIGVPIGGTVVRIQWSPIPGINNIVELQASDGSVMLYQHITAKVSLHQTLGCGDVIGTENGLPVNLGPPLISNGPHIEVRYCRPGSWSPSTDQWLEPWVNPFPIFSVFSNQQAGTVGTGGGGGFGGLGGIFFGSAAGTPVVGPPVIKNLASNADVTAALMFLDLLGVMVNPFTAASAAAQVDTIGIPNPLGTGTIGPGLSFTDPMSWITDFGTACLLDFTAFVFRAFLVLLGVILVIKVVTQWVDFGKYASEGAGIVGKLAVLAA